MIGIVYKEQGDFKRAFDYLRQSLNYLRQIGDSRSEAFAAWHIGEIYEQQGHLVEAVELMEFYVTYARSTDNPNAEDVAQRVQELRRRLQNDS
jgi:tetratricopeptide (TPR) repeat protein